MSCILCVQGRSICSVGSKLKVSAAHIQFGLRCQYYRKRESASYIVREVRSVRDERDESETEVTSP